MARRNGKHGRTRVADPLLARDPAVGIVLATVGALGLAGLVAVVMDRRDLTLGEALFAGCVVGLGYTRLVLDLYRWGRLAIREDGGVVYSPVRFGLLVLVIVLPLIAVAAAFVVGRLMLAPPREALLAQTATGAVLSGFFLGAGLYYVRPPDR